MTTARQYAEEAARAQQALREAHRILSSPPAVELAGGAGEGARAVRVVELGVDGELGVEVLRPNWDGMPIRFTAEEFAAVVDWFAETFPERFDYLDAETFGQAVKAIDPDGSRFDDVIDREFARLRAAATGASNSGEAS